MKRNTHRYFAYQLALRLGRLNVDRMLRQLTAKQFLEWEEYATLEPLNQEDRREDWRTAAVLKATFDANQRLIDALLAVHGVERHKRPHIVNTDLRDFVLEWTIEDAAAPKKKRRQQTWQEQWAIVEMINHAFGGTTGNA